MELLQRDGGLGVYDISAQEKDALQTLFSLPGAKRAELRKQGYSADDGSASFDSDFAREFASSLDALVPGFLDFAGAKKPTFYVRDNRFYRDYFKADVSQLEITTYNDNSRSRTEGHSLCIFKPTTSVVYMTYRRDDRSTPGFIDDMVTMLGKAHNLQGYQLLPFKMYDHPYSGVAEVLKLSTLRTLLDTARWMDNTGEIGGLYADMHNKELPLVVREQSEKRYLEALAKKFLHCEK